MSHLADTGLGLGTTVAGLIPQHYPVAIPRNLRNIATFLQFIVPEGGQVAVELFRNGVALPGFATVYIGGESGVKGGLPAPVAFAFPDYFDLQVTTSGLGVGAVNVSATIGVE
jgi:hypothetical protein